MCNSVSTLNVFNNNSYLEYIFDNTLHKFQCNIFSSKIKSVTAKKELNYVFRLFFLDGKEVYNRQKHQLPYARAVAPRTASLFSNQRSNPLF